MDRHGRLFAQLGAHVRRLREARDLSQRALAERAGLSLRFLSDVESGHGNISIGRLADLAGALELPLSQLLPDTAPTLRAGRSRTVLALIGLRGAGKSTIGALLAPKLHRAFVELDEEIERRAGLQLAELFALHGETYYRRTEHEVLGALLATDRPLVIATGGGIVSDAATWSLLRSHARTIWLRARPEDHMNRVLDQGDARPMADRPRAMNELVALLDARAPLYAQADLTIETSGRKVVTVVDEIVKWARR